MNRKRRRSMEAVVAAWLLAFSMLPLLAYAQGGQPELGIVEVDATDFPTIQARVGVRGRDGFMVPDLTADHFAVIEDGQNVPLASVQPTTNPDVRIAVVLAIDISGSMEGQKVEDAKAAAIGFVDSLGPNDQVAVIAFRDRGGVDLGEPFPQLNPEREIDFTTNKEDAKALIGMLQAPVVPGEGLGRTPLYDAAFKAGKLAARASAVDFYRLVILFTDGNENCAACPGSVVMEADDPIDLAAKEGIPIFTIGLGDDADAGYLQRVALKTEGQYFFAATSDQLAAQYQTIHDRLTQQYILTFESLVMADGKEHSVDIKVATPGGEEARNVKTVVYPCPAERPGVRLFYLKKSVVPGEESKQVPLEDGLEVSGLFTIAPLIDSCEPIDYVVLYIDGTPVYTATREPFRLSHDFQLLQGTSPGEHTLLVRAYDSADPPRVSEDLTTLVTVAPLPEGEPTTAQDIPLWVWGVLIAVLAVLLLGLFLYLQRRRKQLRRCPSCGRTMAPDWTECMFCEKEGAGAPQPAIGAGVPSPLGAAGYDFEQTEPEGMPAYPYPMPATGQAGPKGAVEEEWPTAAWPGAAQPADPGIQAQARFSVERGVQTGQTFPLYKGETTIGRERSSDIALQDPSVSRQHAKVRLEGGRFTLYDLGATNQTFVNNRPIVTAQLRDGDRVQVGESVLVFREGAAPW